MKCLLLFAATVNCLEDNTPIWLQREFVKKKYLLKAGIVSGALLMAVTRPLGCVWNGKLGKWVRRAVPPPPGLKLIGGKFVPPPPGCKLSNGEFVPGPDYVPPSLASPPSPPASPSKVVPPPPATAPPATPA